MIFDWKENNAGACEQFRGGANRNYLISDLLDAILWLLVTDRLHQCPFGSGFAAFGH